MPRVDSTDNKEGLKPLRFLRRACTLLLVTLAACRPGGFDRDGVATPIESSRYRVTLGAPELVPDPGVPIYTWFPDGHISIVPHDGLLQMYWAGASSYRTVGPDLDHMALSPNGPLLEKGPAGGFDNGGAWLMSVFPRGGGRMIGFYHAEDHEWPGYENPQYIAWKSVALATSYDNGATWHKQGQILTSPVPKPAVPTWGGSGDPSFVWDKAHQRWYCFFQEHVLFMAISDDPEARPGTWKKYFRGRFSEEGLGGGNSPIPVLDVYRGANPSVHWNRHLNLWLITWHTWTGAIAVAYSEDLVNWKEPRILLQFEGNAKNWYPTIIGSTDLAAGEHAWLYYAHWPDRAEWRRRFHRRPLTFARR